MVIALLIPLHVINAALRKGYVEEYHADRKFTCSGKQTGSTTSEIQCIHRCLSTEMCSIANYKESTDENATSNNCETFDISSHHGSCSSEHSVNWKGLVLWVR